MFGSIRDEENPLLNSESSVNTHPRVSRKAICYCVLSLFLGGSIVAAGLVWYLADHREEDPAPSLGSSTGVSNLLSSGAGFFSSLFSSTGVESPSPNTTWFNEGISTPRLI